MCIRKFPDFGEMANVSSTFKEHLLYGYIKSEAQKKESKKKKKKGRAKTDTFLLGSKIGAFYLFMVNLHLNGGTL